MYFANYSPWASHIWKVFLDFQNNIFKQWLKASIVFETEYIPLLKVIQVEYIRIIKVPMATNNWDVKKIQEKRFAWDTFCVTKAENILITIDFQKVDVHSFPPIMGPNFLWSHHYTLFHTSKIIRNILITTFNPSYLE